MLRRFLVLTLATASLALLPTPARAVLSTLDAKTTSRAPAGTDALQAQQYRLPESRVAGADYVRQTITVFEVTAGTWNGQSLQGLTLVLVHAVSDTGPSLPTFNCYISHLATSAQRDALLSAYLAAQSLTPQDITSWRIEPAVIRLDIAGPTITMHLGLVA